MMPAAGLNSAMRRRSSSVLPSLLVMKIVLGAGEVRRRFAQGAARQQVLVAERLLAVNQHDVLPPAAQSPVLKTVVQQQRVAAEFLNRVTPALHAVLVHQHHHVLQIRREHVGFVAGHFGIEQERFAVGHDARRRLVFAQEDFVQQPAVEAASVWNGSRARGWRRCALRRAVRARIFPRPASCRCRRRSGCRWR